jgi:hypothetical protein
VSTAAAKDPLILGCAFTVIFALGFLKRKIPHVFLSHLKEIPQNGLLFLDRNEQ